MSEIERKVGDKLIQDLKIELEKAKRDLSTVQQVKIYIEGLIDGIDCDGSGISGGGASQMARQVRKCEN